MPFSSSALTRGPRRERPCAPGTTNWRRPCAARSSMPCRIAASQSSSAPHTSAAVRSGSSISRGFGEDGVGVDAVGEHAAVAIEDLAPLRRNVDGVELLALGARLAARRAERPAGRRAAPRWPISPDEQTRRRRPSGRDCSGRTPGRLDDATRPRPVDAPRVLPDDRRRGVLPGRDDGLDRGAGGAGPPAR